MVYQVGDGNIDESLNVGAPGQDVVLCSGGGQLSLFGDTLVSQGAALTPTLTTITPVAPGTPNYYIQDLIDTNAYGFVTKDEGSTVLSVILNLQTRVNQLEARLVAFGVIA